MLIYAETFRDDTTPFAQRVSFMFVVRGTERQGVEYVTQNLVGVNRHNAAQKAARIACKRAGSDTAVLHLIVNLVR